MKLLIIGLGLGVLACAAESPTVEGNWLGNLTVQGVTLRLLVHLKSGATGLTGVMDSIDQSAQGIPMDQVEFTGGQLSFHVPSIAGAFQGSLTEAGAISGTWSQGAGAWPLQLKRTTEPVTLHRPQEPKPPFPYVAEEVGYDNPQAKDVRLAGTFTHPKGAGPFPAVLLITGSGKQNRDEEIFGHKPFLVIADYLTRRGIAVLRVDDRSAGGSTGNFAASTTEDFATDVTAGVHYLLTRADVDKKHIGLLGHSEGGVIAPMVAARMPQVAFIVLLAGTGLPGDQIVAGQTAKLNLLAGATPQQAAESREFELKLLTIVKTEPDPVERDKKLLAMASGNPGLEKTLQAQLPTLNSPWYRYFLALDPRPILEKVKCPVLALNGSQDAQVDPDKNLPAIQSALKAGGNLDVTTRVVPGVNHLFQESKTGAVSEYGNIEQTISPQVLSLIGDWIQKHTS